MLYGLDNAIDHLRVRCVPCELLAERVLTLDDFDVDVCVLGHTLNRCHFWLQGIEGVELLCEEHLEADLLVPVEQLAQPLYLARV